MCSKVRRKIVYKDFDLTLDREEGVIILSLSGFKRDEIKVQIASTNQILKVRGEQKMEDKNSVRRRFCKEISLPRDVNINQISAELKDEKLYIKLPKTTTMKKPPSHKKECAVSIAKQVSLKEWIGFIVALLMFVLVLGLGLEIMRCRVIHHLLEHLMSMSCFSMCKSAP